MSGTASHRLSINMDTRLKLVLTLATVLGAACIITARGLRFPPADSLEPLGLVALLCGVAWFYHQRDVPIFVASLTALAHLVLFCPAFATLMYAVATTHRPLADSSLIQLDQMCGFHAPDVVAWVRDHHALNVVLTVVYDTLLPQTILVIAVLGFSGDRPSLDRFILRFMVCALATLALFYFFPATGPFAAFGFAPGADQARYLDHLQSLREGRRLLVSWRDAEGLITFPSFHTTWAILLALAFRRRPVLFAISAILNAVVIVSTLTTGWHYLTDVLGGILVSVAVLVPLDLLDRRREARVTS
jgi:membrane-associated phospholipid phosphatase